MIYSPGVPWIKRIICSTRQGLGEHSMNVNMPISETEIETIFQGHESRNAALRQTLIEKGVDLGEPRATECHVWSWSPANAGVAHPSHACKTWGAGGPTIER